ncbi:hypothetical protein Lepto7376_2831 [[Leptolyngbya] sp. PCC 7376]|uniref:hypothetical protein n=1 Tax=[Leptolyngbya] sp. PCC 7376 TaxID=111781 RepID=UPI00029F4705|nr:hypothetical protein [[Leptolyngbya] sp. PCC 7376]AFY39087.1 hypothetical protein Lepto7376_2831 [[Leptolyngbya] sp. PCC 7376]
MQWPPYLPYPIAFIRTLFQLSAIAVATQLIIGSSDLDNLFPILFLSPFGLVSFLLIPVVMMTALHWIFQNILHQLKGVPKPKVIHSLWEGIYGWMVAIFACTLTTFLFVVPTFVAVGFDPIYEQYTGYIDYIDEDEFLLSCLIIYTAIALYLYHLEHLIRFPIAGTKNIRRSQKTSQPPAEKKQTSSQSPQQKASTQKKAVPVTPDEIELELERLKKNHRNNTGLH